MILLVAPATFGGPAWRVRRYAVVTLALVTPRPFTIRGDLTALLSLGAASLWPRSAVRDLPSKQDACNRAVVRFAYSGLANR